MNEVNEKITQVTLRRMKLHERIAIDIQTQVLRVPDGWIYLLWGPYESCNNLAVFVPEA